MLMKMLSIRQPWVWAILHGGKRIENRTWKTAYRGPILLHASIAFDLADIQVVRHVFMMEGRDPDKVPYPSAATETFNPYPRGGIVGCANLVDIIDDSDSRWFAGPTIYSDDGNDRRNYGFVLEDVRELPFTPSRGQLGLAPVDIVGLGLQEAFNDRAALPR